MTTYFNQRNQNVKSQTNVTGNLNATGNYIAGDIFDNAQNQVDVQKELEKLLELVTNAADNRTIDEDTAVDMESSLKKAINRAKKNEPDKKGIIAYPDSAKGLLEGAASAGGLVTAFTKAVEAVRKFF
jgi:hypothetical protein